MAALERIHPSLSVLYSPADWESIIKIEGEKNSEYICLTYEDKSKTQGTEIVLDYEQFMSIFPNGISEIKSFVEDNFLI